ncbi:NADH/ubiquinone/plastoquinone (complex I) [Glycocaulis profundi]|nr:NADH/ubiquinone/plastoquinone (complex I) [Glycocaulis profundi]
MTDPLLLLLPLSLALPLVLAGLSVLPGWRAHSLAVLPLAPLPALAAALLAPRGAEMVFPDLLLGMRLGLDPVGVYFLGGAALLWTLSGVYAARYMTGKDRPGGFALFWNLVLAGNLVVFLATDAVTFYVAFAQVSLMAYPLITHDRSARALKAGTVYIALAVVGETALLLGLMLGAAEAGNSLMIADIRSAIAGSDARGAILALLIAGFGIKAGLIPLHVWLPVAHPAAPTPASAVLSGAIVKAGIFGLIAFLPFAAGVTGWGLALAGLGFSGAVLAALYGTAQTNPKAVLAYSTVSQMGLLMGALGIALIAEAPPGPALFAAALYALHHGLAKGALFLGVGVMQTSAGAWRKAGLALLALAALSVAGLPLTGGALAKIALKGAAGGLAELIITASALTTALVLARFLAVLPKAEPDARPPLAMLVPMGALAFAALLLPAILFTGAAGEDLAYALSLSNLFAGVWPLALAALAVIIVLRLKPRAPALPEGDLLIPATALGQAVWRGLAHAAHRAGTSLSALPRRLVPKGSFLVPLSALMGRVETRLGTAPAIALLAALLVIALVWSGLAPD